MAHSPKPFYKQKRNTWYCQIAGVQHCLGKHPSDAPPPKRKPAPEGRQRVEWEAPPQILAAFYRLMAVDAEKPKPLPVVTGQLVIVVFDEFLTWCQKHKADLTYVWYRDRIKRLIARQLTAQEGESLLLRAYADLKILSPRTLPLALREWREPSYEYEGEKGSAWQLFNAVTFALQPRLKSNPQSHASATIQLGNLFNER